MEKGEADKVIIQSQGQQNVKEKNVENLSKEHVGIHYNILVIFL